MRETFLPFASPTIGDAEVAAVIETLRGGWLTTGPKAKEFEQRFAGFVGSRHAIAVNSCTAAMHLALEAIGLKSGDEVITTPMTFAATGEVVRYFGARPIFVDIDPVTMNIDPSRLAGVIDSCTKPKAVIPVHIAGLACNMDPICEVASSHGLKVIEDAAHTLPTRYRGRTAGTIGDVGCFSFYSTKTITTGEGGMAVTDDDEIADRMRVMSLHGISKDAWKRYTASGSWAYQIIAPGFKYNMPDIAASLGLAQLAQAGAFHARRQAIAARYTEALAALTEYVETPPDAPEDGLHSWHLYVVKLRLDRLSISRAQFIEEMRTRNIGCSVHFIPLHLHPYYSGTYGLKPEDFPVASAVSERIVSLPIYPAMRDEDVGSVVEAIITICEQHGT